MRHRYAPTPTERFVQELIAIGGKPAALWLPGYSVVKTAYDPTGIRIFTSANTPAPTAQGNGALLTFNGSSDYWTTPDTDDLSFGNGTTDSPFSIVALANHTAANRGGIIAKWDAAPEYYFQIDATGHLGLVLFDNAHNVQVSRVTSGAITEGATHLFGVSYPGVGGATAMTSAVLYQDAAVAASTAANSASYVAMENGTDVVNVGRQQAGLLYFTGSMAFSAVFAANLSAAQHASIKSAVNRYYGLAL